MLILVFRDWRRLTIADMTLMGLAAGLGFQFVETNFDILTGIPVFSRIQFSIFPLYVNQAFGDYAIRWTGHGVPAALICLAVAIGIRFWPRSQALCWVLVLLTFCFVVFEHSMLNWKVLPLPMGGTLPNAPPWVEMLYTATWHGGAGPALLVVGLLVASSLEARACWKAVAGDQKLLLPRETQPSIREEWRIVFDRFSLGPHRQRIPQCPRPCFADRSFIAPHHPDRKRKLRNHGRLESVAASSSVPVRSWK